MRSVKYSGAATLVAMTALLGDKTQACSSNCLNAWGEVNCISDDFKRSKCCHHSDTGCMGQFRWCTRGIWNYDYTRLTCPAQDCPNGNNPIRHKHDRFGQRVEHKRDWSWDWSLDGFYCRMIIEADVTLNGKIELEIVSNGHQSVTVYQMPGNFGQGDYWGIFPNNQIYRDVNDGNTFSVPTDWYLMILFEVDYDRMYGTQSVVIRSQVSDYTDNDAYNIKNSWQPTATEYISPQEKQRREQEKQRQIHAKIKAEKEKKRLELAEAKRKAEIEAKKKEEELATLKKQEELEKKLLEEKLRENELKTKQLEEELKAKELAEEERKKQQAEIEQKKRQNELEYQQKLQENQFKQQLLQEEIESLETTQQQSLTDYLENEQASIDEAVATFEEEQRLREEEEMIARQVSVVDASIYMQTEDQVQEWEKRTDLDTESIVIMSIIAFLILLFGICIGGIIVIKCKRMHTLIDMKQAAEDGNANPEPIADIAAQQFELNDLKDQKQKGNKGDDVHVANFYHKGSNLMIPRDSITPLQGQSGQKLSVISKNDTIPFSKNEMLAFETPNLQSHSKVKAVPIKNKAFDVDDLIIDDDNSMHDTHYGVGSAQKMERGTRQDKLKMDQSVLSQMNNTQSHMNNTQSQMKKTRNNPNKLNQVDSNSSQKKKVNQADPFYLDILDSENNISDSKTIKKQ